MSERCLTTDYDLRGQEFEIWREGDCWWLVARKAVGEALGLPADTVLTSDDFDPPLTDAEIQRISDYVFDRL